MAFQMEYNSKKQEGERVPEDKIFLNPSAEELELPPKTANKDARTIFISAKFGSEIRREVVTEMDSYP